MIRACGQLGIPVSETPFTLEDLLGADEIITSSSTAPCVRACSVDGQQAGMQREDLFTAIKNAIFEEYYSETDLQ
ncbi:MAG: D-amino acid aminotransferase, partial [Clostridia bacterium]|nr:D-amino acid aminotransferase [Clostridia bacterium]